MTARAASSSAWSSARAGQRQARGEIEDMSGTRYSAASASSSEASITVAMTPDCSRTLRSIDVGDLGMVAQELLGVLAALADALAVDAVPGARLLHHADLGAEVDQLADLADALAVHDVELDLAERRRHLVLDHLHPRLVADDLVAVLDRADAADFQADGGVELQRVAARGGLRVAEHDADLQADLVEEDQHGVAAADAAGQLAQRLAHQARMQADMAVAHLALQLGPRHQGGDRVDHQHVDRARAHQRVGDLQRLLAGVGLADQQVIDIDAELAGIGRGRARARRR